MKKILCFLIIFFHITSYACAADPIGKYTYIEGSVDVLHKGEPGATPVISDQPVYTGDIVRTKSFSKAEIKFNDNSILRIAPGSRAGIDEYLINPDNTRDKASLMLYRGKIRTVVSKTKGETNFFINTPNAQGSVRGSDIFVFYQADNTGVLVAEGAIDTFNTAFPDKITNVKEGTSINIPLNEAPKDMRKCLDIEKKLHGKDTDPPAGRQQVYKELPAQLKALIVKKSGTVLARTGTDVNSHDAKLNEILNEGDGIQVKEDGTAEIRLENGNSIVMQANSELEIKKLRRDPKTGEYENLLEAKSGKIKAVVEKLPGKSKFEIRTPVALCGVRGTIMYLDISRTSTQAFYEGGGGIVTNLISGATETLEMGQNTTADIQGTTQQPVFTTNEQRIAMNQTWDMGAGTDSYQAPQNIAYQDAPPIIQQPLQQDTQDTTQPVDNNSTGTPPIYIPPDDNTNNPPPENGGEIIIPGPATGHFGIVSSTGPNSCAFTDDVESNFTDIEYDFIPPGSSQWANLINSTTEGGFYAKYTESITPHKLWRINNYYEGTTSDNGAYMGWIMGRERDLGASSTLITAMIYVDPDGNGGVITNKFDVTDDTVSYVGSDTQVIRQLQTNVGIDADQLFSAAKDIETFKGLGYGQGPGGTLECTNLGGGSMALTGKDWGIWNISAMGTWTGPITDNFKIALGGEVVGDAKSTWLGTVDGTMWNLGYDFEGDFEGFWFSDADDAGGDLVKVGYVKGAVVGDYTDLGGYGDWDAIGAGEWQEISDVLSETYLYLNFTMDELRTLAQTGVSEFYRGSMSAVPSAEIGTATMDIRAYTDNNPTHTQIWAATIEGTWVSNPTGTYVDFISVSAETRMNIDAWGSYKWHAFIENGALNGLHADDGHHDFYGEAAGAYSDDGTFSGIAAGSWEFSASMGHP